MDKPVVLVAEDYADVRQLYASFLAEAGFEVMTARDGNEAVAVAKAAEPAAIVMDLQLPEKHGWDAIREIRAFAVDPRPYIIAVTAHFSDGSRVDAYEAGADDFVAKPLTPHVLCSIVQAALKARE